MSQQAKYPAGWDEEKVRRVLAHYDQQTEEDALLEDEAGVEPSETVMNVPHDLVPKASRQNNMTSFSCAWARGYSSIRRESARA